MHIYENIMFMTDAPSHKKKYHHQTHWLYGKENQIMQFCLARQKVFMLSQ